MLAFKQVPLPDQPRPTDKPGHREVTRPNENEAGTDEKFPLLLLERNYINIKKRAKYIECLVEL